MQMTIQEIKNAIKYNELNNIETLQAAYTGVKYNNDGIIQTLGYDDLSNIVMMLRYLAKNANYYAAVLTQYMMRSLHLTYAKQYSIL